MTPNEIARERFIYMAGVDWFSKQADISRDDVRKLIYEYGTLKLENLQLEERIKNLEAKLSLAAANTTGSTNSTEQG